VLIEPLKDTTRKGAEIYFVLGGERTFAKVELIFPAGRWYEKAWGASYFYRACFQRNKNKNAVLKLAELFDGYGAHLELNAGMDFVPVDIYTLNKNLEPSLDLLMQLLQESVFSGKELDQLKSIITESESNNEKTSFSGSTLFRRRCMVMTLNDWIWKKTEVASWDVKPLVAHYNDFLMELHHRCRQGQRKNQQLIKDSFALFSLNTLKAAPHNAAEKNGAIAAGRHQVEVFKVRSYRKTSVGREHEDYAAVYFLYHILGGYFGCVNEDIREERDFIRYSSSVHTMVRGNFDYWR
jgi:predicted Zn-dependent peptidase